MWKRENLRKNFLRVKQIADQNLGRAEKSEVLTEEQQGSEKRVELVSKVSHNLIKKITALLEAQPGSDVEKRLKKLPETGLSHALIESAGLLDTDSLLGAICNMCGECESVLAREELQCELDIERDVLTPLQQLAEVDIPSIIKLRKQLNKSTLDMDSAKNRFNSAVRQSHVPGANMASAAAKADAVREEYEEAQNKVEVVKDNLSIELCNFIAKESEHSSRLVALLEAQARFHKKALEAITDVIPKMKAEIDAFPSKPLFGMPLEEHLRVTSRDIALVLEACIVTLHETGMEEEGLFRIAGSALKLKKLRACLDAHLIDMEEFSTDPHTVAGVMKQYLRELPEPLLTFGLHHEFMQTTTLLQEQRLQALQNAVNKLPPANYNNMRYLIRFLALLAQNSSKNKMTPSNIGIVMGPNLLWSRGETTPNMLTAGAVSAIIEAFVINAERFFPGAAEFDFHLTGRGCAPPSPYRATPSSAVASLAANTVAQAEALLPRSASQPDVVESPQQEPCPALEPPERSTSSQEDVRTEPTSEPSDSEEVVVGWTDNSAAYSPSVEAVKEVMTGAGQEIDYSMSGPFESPSQDMPELPITTSAPPPSVIQTPLTNSSAPPTLQASPVATSVSQAANNISPTTAESPDGPHSPKVQRRQTKKPAPPPPPDRPYTVSVSAMARSTEAANPYQTWPRSAPLASPDSPQEQTQENQQ